jgi:hypothetical protein
MSLVRYEMGFYIPEDGILHDHGPCKPESLHNLFVGLIRAATLRP